MTLDVDREAVQAELDGLEAERDKLLHQAKQAFVDTKATIRGWYFGRRRKLTRLLEVLDSEEPPK